MDEAGKQLVPPARHALCCVNEDLVRERQEDIGILQFVEEMFWKNPWL